MVLRDVKILPIGAQRCCAPTLLRQPCAVETPPIGEKAFGPRDKILVVTCPFVQVYWGFRSMHGGFGPGLLLAAAELFLWREVNVCAEL